LFPLPDRLAFLNSSQDGQHLALVWAFSATSDSASHIVDRTDEYLGRAFIITGAPEPKK
jgi:hypothetical protein